MIRTGILQGFRSQEDGSVLTVFALMLAIFFGILALSYDFGRVASTQSELQSFADNVALAAAGELDGEADSISRAQLAAATLVADWQTYGEGDNDLSGLDEFTLAFYAARPPQGGSAVATSDPHAARYVSVTINDRAVTPILGAVFGALTDNGSGRDSVDAHALAGFSQYACDVTPLMVCAPTVDFSADASIGQEIQLETQLTVNKLDPGTLAFLNPVTQLVGIDSVCAGLSGLGLDLCMIAAEGDRGNCVGPDISEPDNELLSLELNAALNLPFDIFGGPAAGLVNNPLFTAAPNVVSGYAPASGQRIGDNPITAVGQIGLPSDDCQGTTCSLLGDGNWSGGRENYINVNYGGTDPHPTAETRFQFYLAEIEAMANTGGGGGGLLGGGLLGGGGVVGGLLGGLLGPTCTSQVSADPARRVIVTAVVDCNQLSAGVSISDLPIQEYAELFLTNPTGLDGTNTVSVEVLGRLSDDPEENVTNSFVRDVIRLYD